MFRIVCVLLIVIILWGVAAALAFGSTGHIYYSDGPWKGTVIDAETKEPLEGVVVVAIWEKKYGGPAGPYTYFLDAVEAMTDKDGQFVIPKYWKWNWVPFVSWIEGPTFEIFKPGYTAFPGGGWNYFKYFPKSPLGVDLTALADLFKKGIVVELLKLRTREERLTNYPGRIDDVGTEKLPLFYGLINQETKDLGLNGEIGRNR
jgi:hypothetical protein